MSDYRIICKIHDSQKRVIRVGIGTDQYSTEQVWDWIASGYHTFHTFENNRRAEVKRGISRDGRKYLTTSRDGVTENNLDELRICS